MPKNKFEAIENRNGTVFVYEDGVYIGTIDLCNFPLAGFARIMRAANETHLTTGAMEETVIRKNRITEIENRIT